MSDYLMLGTYLEVTEETVGGGWGRRTVESSLTLLVLLILYSVLLLKVGTR